MKQVLLLSLLLGTFDYCQSHVMNRPDCDSLVKHVYELNAKYNETKDTAYSRKVIITGDSLDDLCSGRSNKAYIPRVMAYMTLREFRGAISLLQRTDSSQFFYRFQKRSWISMVEYQMYKYQKDDIRARQIVDSVSFFYEKNIFKSAKYPGVTMMEIFDYMYLNVLEKDTIWVDGKIEEFAFEYPEMAGSILALKESLYAFKKDFYNGNYGW